MKRDFNWKYGHGGLFYDFVNAFAGGSNAGAANLIQVNDPRASELVWLFHCSQPAQLVEVRGLGAAERAEVREPGAAESAEVREPGAAEPAEVWGPGAAEPAEVWGPGAAEPAEVWGPGAAERVGLRLDSAEPMFAPGLFPDGV